MKPAVPTPGSGATYRPAQNANNADDGTPPLKSVDLNQGTGGPAPTPAFNPRDALFRFRMRFPNLQIIPVPNKVVGRVLAANAAQNLQFPDGTLAVLFFATAPFWANFDGAAAVPVTNSTDNSSMSLMIPPNFVYMLWVQGKSQISVLAEQAATVQAFCYIDLPLDAK